MPRSLRSPLASAVAIAATVLVLGCGVGPGPSTEGVATLEVTSAYGQKPIDDASVDDPASSETVLRLLDRETQITTRYGGGFVQSIDGLEGGLSDGRSSDWFFYVNGIESPVGAAEVKLRAGDRVWWDYRDWTDAMRVPAVVGSYPEPLLQASTPEGERKAVSVRCSAAAVSGSACQETLDRLRRSGVGAEKAPLGAAGSTGFEVLVGPYSQLADRPELKLLEQGPKTSGVFAGFESGGRRLDGLAVDASTQTRLGAGAGILAAVRRGTDQPAWIVSGTDESGVEAAASMLQADTLKDRYAVLTDGSEATPVPLAGEAGGGA